MSIDYEKDNKTRIPFEHYKQEYAKLDPLEVSKVLIFHMMKKDRYSQ